MRGRSKVLLACALILALLAALWTQLRRTRAAGQAVVVAEREERADGQAPLDTARGALAETGIESAHAPVAAPSRQVAGALQRAGETRAPRARATPPSGSRPLHGRVVFPPGTPADERVAVLAITSRGRSAWSSRNPAEVAADGAFTLWLEEDEILKRVLLEARYLLREPSAASIDADGVLVVEPELGGLVRGRLTGLTDSDADDVDIVLFGAWGLRHAGSLDEDGGFEVGALDPGSSLRLEARLGNFVKAEAGPFELAAGETVELELEVAPAATLAGRVEDGSGVGIGGARVTLRDVTESRYYLDSTRVHTDTTGAFTITGLPRGDLELTVERAGWLPQRTSIASLAAGERREGLRVTLERGHRLAGVVLLPDARPAAGARVTLEQPDEAGRRDLRVDADEHGRFRFSGLAESECTLAVELESDRAAAPRVQRLAARLAGVVPPAEGLLLQLDDGETLAGRVLDDAGEPVRAFRVTVDPAARSGAQPLRDSWRRLIRADDGRFELAGLAPGEWTVEVHAAKHASVERQHVLVPRGAPLELRLEREAVLTGRVRLPDGRPAAGAWVRARAIAGELSDRGTTRTLEGGAFAGLAVPPGTYRVSAALDGCAPSPELVVSVAADEERGGLELVLRSPARLEVAVTRADGRPAARCSVVLSTRDRPVSYGSADLAGVATFEDLAPGSYEVEALIYPNDFQQENRVVATGAALRPPRDSAEVVLIEGQEARVELTPTAPEAAGGGSQELDSERLRPGPERVVRDAER